MASRLVLVEQAFVSHRIDHALGGSEKLGCFGFVASQHGFLNVLDDGAKLGPQCRVSSIELGVLANSLQT